MILYKQKSQFKDKKFDKEKEALKGDKACPRLKYNERIVYMNFSTPSSLFSLCWDFPYISSPSIG